MTEPTPFPEDRRYRIVPLEGTGASVAFSHTFSGMIYAVPEGSHSRFVVRVVNGQAETVVEELGDWEP